MLRALKLRSHAPQHAPGIKLERDQREPIVDIASIAIISLGSL